MRREYEHRLADLAARQYQVFTRAQLVGEIGLTSTAVDNLVRNGRFSLLRRGVYTFSGCRPDLRTAVYAATVGSRLSACSHRAASRLWRLPGGEDIVEVTSPRWRRLRGETLAGFPLSVHETYHLTDRDVVEVDGIWRTRVDRTLVDLGASVALGHLDVATVTLAIQDAIRRNLTDIPRLETTFARLAQHIRFGAREFREAIDRFQPVLADAESPPEIKVGLALLAAGFKVVPQYELKLSAGWTVRLDFFVPEVNRGVEVSPDCTHGGLVQKRYDAVRALRVRRLHGIESSVVTDEEIDNGCRELLALLHTLRRAAA